MVDVSPIICTQRISGPGAWKASAFRREDDWILALDAEDRRELQAALGCAKTTGKPLADLTVQDFPLSGLSRKLRLVLDDLESGKGFAVLRGFPLEGYASSDIELMYWGLGAHLGAAVVQNALGERLVHVRNYGKGGLANKTLRAYQTLDALPFHTDSPDIVALLCLRNAPNGGLSMMASSATIHNELLEYHRELLGIFYTGFLYDRRGEELPGEAPFYRNCVYTWLEEKLSCRYYMRAFIESAQDKSGIPLMAVERQALDTFEAIALRAENRIEMALQPGDIQFCENNLVVHARTAYQDIDGERDLLRLWLNPHQPRTLGAYSAKFRFGMPVKRVV
jgi:hypothetical protein